MNESNENQNAHESAVKTPEERQAIIESIMRKLKQLGLFSSEAE